MCGLTSLAYTYTRLPLTAPAFPCPLLAFGGDADERAPPETMTGWSRFTSTKQFDLHIFNGGHFFIKQEGPAMVEMIGEKVM